MKVKKFDMVPQEGPFDAGSHNCSSGTFKNDWEDLLKVSTKNNSNTTKGLIRATQVLKGLMNCLYNMTMLHGCLIPYNQVCLTDQIRQVSVLVNAANGVLIDRDRDFKA
jgi:hypothetical protein